MSQRSRAQATPPVRRGTRSRGRPPATPAVGRGALVSGRGRTASQRKARGSPVATRGSSRVAATSRRASSRAKDTQDSDEDRNSEDDQEENKEQNSQSEKEESDEDGSDEESNSEEEPEEDAQEEEEEEEEEEAQSDEHISEEEAPKARPSRKRHVRRPRQGSATRRRRRATNNDSADTADSSPAPSSPESEKSSAESSPESTSSSAEEVGKGYRTRFKRARRPSTAGGGASGSGTAGTKTPPQTTPTAAAKRKKRVVSKAPKTRRKNKAAQSNDDADSEDSPAGEPSPEEPQIPPPPLPEAMPLVHDITARAAGLALGKGRSGRSGVDALSPEFLEDLVACWDFLHLMAVAETKDYRAPIPSPVPGQPPLPELGEKGTRLRSSPSPLGSNLGGGKPPSLPQLYAAVMCPERGWLDALQVRLVDMIQAQLVMSLEKREIAVTIRPNSLTWPEFARQAISALLFQWAEQDTIYGDTSGSLAPPRSQGKGMKAGAKRGYQGQGDDNQPQLSPACTWLDAQHDARRGTMFLESITGNVDSPPKKKDSGVKGGKSSARNARANNESSASAATDIPTDAKEEQAGTGASSSAENREGGGTTGSAAAGAQPPSSTSSSTALTVTTKCAAKESAGPAAAVGNFPLMPAASELATEAADSAANLAQGPARTLSGGSTRVAAAAAAAAIAASASGTAPTPLKPGERWALPQESDAGGESVTAAETTAGDTEAEEIDEIEEDGDDPDSTVLRALRSWLETWREDNTKLVEKENMARIAAGGSMAGPPGFCPPPPPPVSYSKYGQQNMRRLLTHVQAAPMSPAWIGSLLNVMRVPAKNGPQVKKMIQEAIDSSTTEETPKAALEALKRAINEENFKIAGGKVAKEIAVEALVDHLLDNPSDVVGLELGPGDEPLLPGTLIPMRTVRACDDPPPMFSMATTPGGSSRADSDVKGFGHRDGGDGEAGIVESSGGGAKTDSMRRCRALVRFLATAPSSLVFRKPVDTTLFTDYYQYVEEPIDLRTVDRRLEGSEYGQSVMRFANDVRLVWRNAKRYNKEGSGVWTAADSLGKAFEVLLERWVMGPWRAKRPTKEDKEIKPKKKAGASTEELCAQTEELLTSLNFADLGPVPPWSTEDADPENGGLTEFHIQALLDRVPWSEGCALCGRDDNPDRTLICDRCDREIHMFCLEPKLDQVPEGEFFCPRCMADAQAASTTGANSKDGQSNKMVVATSNDPSSSLGNQGQQQSNFSGNPLAGGGDTTDYNRWAASASGVYVNALYSASSPSSATAHGWNNGGFGGGTPRGPWGVVPARGGSGVPIVPAPGTWRAGGQRPNGTDGIPRNIPPPGGIGPGVVGVRCQDGSVVYKTMIAKLIIRLLAQQQLFLAFLEPVDLVAYPLYGIMIKRPVDLQTMYVRVDKGVFGGLPPPTVPGPPSSLTSLQSAHPGESIPNSYAAPLHAVGAVANGVVPNGVPNGVVGGGGHSAQGFGDTESMIDVSGGKGEGLEALVGIVDNNGGSGRHSGGDGAFFGAASSERIVVGVDEGLSSGGGVLGFESSVAVGSGAVAGGKGLSHSPRRASGAKGGSADGPAVPLEVSTGPFDHASFYRDMKLIWKNAQKFNHDGSPLWIAAEHFKQQLDRLYKERLLTVIQGRTPALARETLEAFLAAPPPWETLCAICGAHADPEAMKLKKGGFGASPKRKKGKKGGNRGGSSSSGGANAEGATAVAGNGEGAGVGGDAAAEEAWPALRCDVCRRPRHVECLAPSQVKKSKGRWICPTCKHQPFAPLAEPPPPPPQAAQLQLQLQELEPSTSPTKKTGAVASQQPPPPKDVLIVPASPSVVKAGSSAKGSNTKPQQRGSGGSSTFSAIRTPSSPVRGKGSVAAGSAGAMAAINSPGPKAKGKGKDKDKTAGAGPAAGGISMASSSTVPESNFVQGWSNAKKVTSSPKRGPNDTFSGGSDGGEESTAARMRSSTVRGWQDDGGLIQDAGTSAGRRRSASSGELGSGFSGADEEGGRGRRKRIAKSFGDAFEEPPLFPRAMGHSQPNGPTERKETGVRVDNPKRSEVDQPPTFPSGVEDMDSSADGADASAAPATADTSSESTASAREERERRRQARLDAVFLEETKKAAERNAARAAAMVATGVESDPRTGDDRVAPAGNEGGNMPVPMQLSDHDASLAPTQANLEATGMVCGGGGDVDMSAVDIGGEGTEISAALIAGAAMVGLSSHPVISGPSHALPCSDLKAGLPEAVAPLRPAAQERENHSVTLNLEAVSGQVREFSSSTPPSSSHSLANGGVDLQVAGSLPFPAGEKGALGAGMIPSEKRVRETACLAKTISGGVGQANLQQQQAQGTTVGAAASIRTAGKNPVGDAAGGGTSADSNLSSVVATSALRPSATLPKPAAAASSEPAPATATILYTIPRPELLGAVVARLAHCRSRKSSSVKGVEGWGDGSSAGEGRSGSSDCSGESDDDDEDDDDDDEEDEVEDQDGKGSGSICSTRRGRRPGTRSSSGGGGSSAGSDAGGAAGSKGEGDGNSGKRRRKRRRRLEAAKVVIREAVVASFDQTDGLYVLQRVDGEVEKMNLENLQTALQQSQVFYSCSERMLPLNGPELEKAVDGILDAEAVVCPTSAAANATSGSVSGGVVSSPSGSEHGSKLDSASLRLVSLLRSRSYATFTPAQRTRLLRGLMDLASATGPIKEHLQLLQDRVTRLEQEAILSERQAACASERQRFEGDFLPLKPVKRSVSPRRSQDFSCHHPDRKHYARGLCVSCYQRWLRNRSTLDDDKSPPLTVRKRPRQSEDGVGGGKGGSSASGDGSGAKEEDAEQQTPAPSRSSSRKRSQELISKVEEDEEKPKSGGGGSAHAESSKGGDSSDRDEEDGAKGASDGEPSSSKDAASTSTKAEAEEADDDAVAKSEETGRGGGTRGRGRGKRRGRSKRRGASRSVSGSTSKRTSGVADAMEETVEDEAAAEEEASSGAKDEAEDGQPMGKSSKGEAKGKVKTEVEESTLATTSQRRSKRARKDDGSSFSAKVAASEGRSSTSGAGSGKGSEIAEDMDVVPDESATVDAKGSTSGKNGESSKRGAGDKKSGSGAKKRTEQEPGNGGAESENGEADTDAGAEAETVADAATPMEEADGNEDDEEQPSTKNGKGATGGLTSEEQNGESKMDADDGDHEADDGSSAAEISPTEERPKQKRRLTLPAKFATAAKTPVKTPAWRERTRRARSPTTFYTPTVRTPSSNSSATPSSIQKLGNGPGSTFHNDDNSTSSSPPLRQAGTSNADSEAGQNSGGNGTGASSGGGSGKNTGNSDGNGGSNGNGPVTLGAVSAGAAASGAEVMSSKERREYRRTEAAARARELRLRGRKLAPITRPLGSDRDGRIYLVFRGDSRAIYVGASPALVASANTNSGAVGADATQDGVKSASGSSGASSSTGACGGKGGPGYWAVFRGLAVEELTKVLLSSPLRNESRLGKAIQNHLGLRIELPLAEESIQPDTGHGTRSTTLASKPRQVPRTIPPPVPQPPTQWHLPVECSIRGAKSEQCEVCLGSCVLFASLRRNAGSSSSGSSGASGGSSLGSGGSASSSQRPSQADHVFAAGAPVKKPKGANELQGSGGARSGGRKAPFMGEAEALTKEGKADIQGLRGAVLKVAESVPVSAWRAGQWLKISYPAWRAFVRSATGPRELMQALLVMEAGISKKWLAKWWTKGWVSPAVAMRVVTVQAVAFRAYTLDSAILYEGSTNGTHADAPPRPSKKRGRPKHSLNGGPPKGARLWKGFHEDACTTCNEGGTLLCCDYCPAAFHMQPCLEMSKAPTGAWACPLCRNGTPKPSKAARSLHSRRR